MKPSRPIQPTFNLALEFSTGNGGTAFALMGRIAPERFFFFRSTNYETIKDKTKMEK
jgi:hypothetical protein